jgi:hypothetical protein
MLPLTKQWTSEETEKLRKLVESGASPIRCAAALKRRVASVRLQARKIGTPFPSRRDVTKALKQAEEDAHRLVRRDDVAQNQ